MPVPTLRRPYASYKLVLKTPLAKQLYGKAIGLANMVAKIGLAAQYGLAPEASKRLAALTFEILAGLQEALAAEYQSLADLAAPQVADFPAELQKELRFCHPQALKVMQILSGLDRAARTWYDLWFWGRLTKEDLDCKNAAWRQRFRRACRQVNNLWQSTQQASRPRLQVAPAARRLG